ncbi:hypothetical protein LTS10_001049 [Elasticomyces elasticus]|nr:hypothetical protein LTS10_001049 [Elasticomyces elasticus]
MADPKQPDIAVTTDAPQATLMTLPDELLLQILKLCIPRKHRSPRDFLYSTYPGYNSFAYSTTLVSKHFRALATTAWTSNYTHNVWIVYMGDQARYNRRLALRHGNIRRLSVRVSADYLSESGVHPTVQDVVEYIGSFPELRELELEFECYENSYSLVATRFGLWEALVAWARQEHRLGWKRKARMRFSCEMRNGRICKSVKRIQW